MPKLDLRKIKEKRERIASQLAELEAQEQAELDRRATLAGHAVLAHAEKDAAFAKTLTEILAQRVRKNRDRALVGLPEKARKPSTRKSKAVA